MLKGLSGSLLGSPDDYDQVWNRAKRPSNTDEAGEPRGATTGPRGQRGQLPDGYDGQGGRHAKSPAKEKGY